MPAQNVSDAMYNGEPAHLAVGLDVVDADLLKALGNGAGGFVSSEDSLAGLNNRQRNRIELRNVCHGRSGSE